MKVWQKFQFDKQYVQIMTKLENYGVQTGVETFSQNTNKLSPKI